MIQRHGEPYTFDKVIRMLLTGLTIGGGLWLLFLLRNVLLPFFIAWLFAYMLNPIVRFLKRKLKLNNSIAVVTTLLCVVAIFALLIVLLRPLIENELYQINNLIMNYELTSITGSGIPLGLDEVVKRYIDFDELKTSLSEKNVSDLIEYISPALKEIFSSTVSILAGVTVFFIVILYLIFILLDYEKINEFWRFLVPPKYRNAVGRITIDVERNMNTYFRHQALICCILAVLYATGFQIIGLPMAIIFGIFVGFIHMIPYLQVISFPPAIILCWLRASQTDDTFWAMIGLTALVYVIIQCLLDGFIVPKIIGKAMGLNPAIILLSLSVWGSLFGLVGMIIAIPMTTLLLSYYKEFIINAENVLLEVEEAEKLEKNG